MTQYREPRIQAASPMQRVTERVHCNLCGAWTENIGTELCDRCYGLKIRVEQNPRLTEEILKALNYRG